MKLFAFQPSYSEDFDPYFVPAETVEEAKEKIRKAYPTRIFSIFILEEILYPGIPREGVAPVKGIYCLKATGETLR